MKLKFSILYSWFVRSATYFLPNYPAFMRFRGFLYGLLMKKCGGNFQVSSTAILNSLSGLTVGKNVYIAPNTVIIGVDILIGDNVLIGPNNVISGANHQFDGTSFRFLPSSVGRVIIGDGAWVAANCTITAHSILPKMSVLAAGSVLAKAYSEEKVIYGGIPARKIKTVS